jgi:dienelactone hydrolase
MTSSDSFEHLGVYSDWVAAAHAQVPLYPALEPGPVSRQRIRDLLGFARDPAAPADVRVDRTWAADGLVGEEISWSVGYGPRTQAWVVRPPTSAGPLPAVVGLHSHDGFKYFGREKIADGPDPAAPEIVQLRERAYQGRAFDHEHLVAKYCSVLGTTLAGVVAYEDRVALAYLKSRPDVIGERIGCAGLSGGGCRAALLQATANDLAAAVVVGMMSTYAGLLDQHVAQHTWMMQESAFGWLSARLQR